MSDENVDAVRAAFEAFGRGGEEWLGFIDPGIEWNLRPDLPDAETFRGHDGVRQILARFEEVIGDMWFEPRELIDAGERVVAPLRWGGRGKGSGVEFEEQEETWVFTVREGKIARVDEYATRATALEAVGLGE